jgi:hypothetical protein
MMSMPQRVKNGPPKRGRVCVSWHIRLGPLLGTLVAEQSEIRWRDESGARRNLCVVLDLDDLG